MKRLLLLGALILLVASPALAIPPSPYDESKEMDTTITDKDMPGPPKNQGWVPQSGKKHPYDDNSVLQVDELSEDPKPPAPPADADTQKPEADKPRTQDTTTRAPGAQQKAGDDLSRPAATGRFERPRRPIEPAAPPRSVVAPPKPAETVPGTAPVTRTPDTRPAPAPAPSVTQPEPRTPAPSPATEQSEPRTGPASGTTPPSDVERPVTKRMPWGAKDQPESKPDESKPKFRWGE